MKTPTVLKDFTGLSDANFEKFASVVYASMNGNANFPSPVPALTDLNNAIQAYSTALSAAESRDKVKVSVKKDARKALEAILINLVSYVNFTAAGNRTLLIESGFNVSPESSNSQPLGDARNFTVSVGANSGEAVVSVDPVPGAKSYTFMYAPAPVTNDAWTVAINSSPGYTFAGLEPSKQYSFRIGIAGSRGQVAYTDVITKMIA